jgi:uncharacterized membrane protein
MKFAIIYTSNKPSTMSMLLKKTYLILGVIFFALACSKDDDNGGPTTPPTTTCSGTPGPKFIAAKAVIEANCVSCHRVGGTQPTPAFDTDCKIVSNATAIKTQAVDLGRMPQTGPLSAADKQKISDWVNAGGKLTD